MFILTIKNITLRTLKEIFLRFKKILKNLKIKFFKHILPLGKTCYCNFLLENLNILKSWEQIKGAKKPVKKTSAEIFLILGINIKDLLSEKFLNKICKK